ncbi:MAG: phosphodiester glycosidase family protein [Clostridiales bacterium]|nr:phosphodiester glycosidase family protein [Clostridiales bacterium]MCF8022865.1 phosphodiester glycosidase family protein [Clostridiales bacterium]
MRNINFFLVFLAAPFIGLALVLVNLGSTVGALELPVEDIKPEVKSLEEKVHNLQEGTGIVSQSIKEQEQEYKEQNERLKELSEQSMQQKNLSDNIYEQRILNRLGMPVKTHESDQVEIKIYSLKELDYRGYIAKIKIFDPGAVKVALGNGKQGEGETTRHAVKRTEAILGINGGGFYPVYQDGKKYILPIGNTVIDGELVNGFSPSHDNLFFAGLTKKADLLGGIFKKKENLLKLNPWQGVSFVPILIRNLKPVDIPEKWQHEKQPRTILGEYGNGDLIMIVVDGRQSSWSRGVTLERLQIKLIELGVIEAYNLDGGGSSAFVYKGEILNRPSDGRQREVPTNILVMP